MRAPTTFEYQGSARGMGWFDVRDEDVFVCRCGWRGTLMELAADWHREVIDGSCRQCDTMLLVRPRGATDAEIYRAARDGHPSAIKMLGEWGLLLPPRRPSAPAGRPAIGRGPRRRRPRGLLRDGVARSVRCEIVRVIGLTRYEPYARVRAVNVWAVIGEHGAGLLAERDERHPEPGIHRTISSVFLPARDGAPGRVFELVAHAWDAETFAADTGDRSVIVAKDQMKREGDLRTAKAAKRLDESTEYELPEGGVLALNAGLTPDEVAALLPGLAAFPPTDVTA